MKYSSKIIYSDLIMVKNQAVTVAYEPNFTIEKGFNLSTVFDCNDEMRHYLGETDYHSLMHNVQKPNLASRKVEALSYFANKLLLQEWVDGLVPMQKTFGFTQSLKDELEIKRIYNIISLRVENLEELIIKPTNGSESIGTLKVFLYQGELKTKFLGTQRGQAIKFNSDEVIANYETFKRWINGCILGVTSGDIDTHLRHIQPGLIVQDLFPHNKAQRGPIEMKFNTAWGKLLYVGCRNAKEVCLGTKGECLKGDQKIASDLRKMFFKPLKMIALALARASTFPNLRLDFFVDIRTGRWVFNEIETLADCRSYPSSILENIGKFYLKGWLEKSYILFKPGLSVSILRERLANELKKPVNTVSGQ